MQASITSQRNSINYQGPVVKSIISLTSLLVVKMLTVLVSTISNSQVFLLKNFRESKTWQMMHMKCLVLFSLHNKRQKIKMPSTAVVISNLTLKVPSKICSR